LSDEITDLHKAGEELLATARESSDGRSSRAVVHGDRMRAVLMALVNGTGLGEHDAPHDRRFESEALRCSCASTPVLTGSRTSRT